MFTNLLFNRRPLIRRVARRPVRPRLVYPVQQLGGNGSDVFYNTVTVISANPSPVTVTRVTTTPYNVLLTDYMLAVDVAGPASIILPIAPRGTVFIVKDIDGDSDVNPINVSAIATTIDGAAGSTINAPYGSSTFIYNGTEWNIV